MVSNELDDVGMDDYRPSAKRVKLSIHPNDLTDLEDGAGKPCSNLGNRVESTLSRSHSMHQPLSENDPLLLKYKLKDTLLVR